MKKVSDHELMKLNNQLAVLRTIRDSGPISRVDLQGRTTLSWGTITSSIRELLGREILREVRAVPTAVGRRPIEVDLNTERNFAVGLQLGSASVRSVLVDVKGNVIGELDAPVNARASRDQIVQRLVGSARTLLARHAVTPSLLAGIGVAAPGAVDFRSGVCHFSPRHPAWKEVPLRRIFESRFRVPCFVDHVSNCFALSEKLFGAGRGVGSFICVLLGTGVSAGIVVNGEVYRGADSVAGEFGHTCIDADGPLCGCGNTGCLEVYASGLALSRLAAEAVRKRPRGLTAALAAAAGADPTGETLCQAARKGDPIAREIFSHMGVYLGIGVSNLVSLLNPERVILGGRVCRACEFFLPVFEATVEKRAWHASTRDIRISILERGAVLGAAALVFQEVFTTGHIVRRGAGLDESGRTAHSPAPLQVGSAGGTGRES
jgi:N-acetylglucosamine repressor